MMVHRISSFDADVASISASRFGVDPEVPFSTLADPEASSVADLLKSIPGVTYTPNRGVILPDPASELGELCGNFLNGKCINVSCSLIHPPFLLLAGAVCSVMTRYCQSKAQLQPSLDFAGFSQPDVGTPCGGSLKASYCRTSDPQGGNPNSALVSISAMADYCDKSHEELRLEDYQLGNKGKKATRSGQEKIEKLYRLFVNNIKWNRHRDDCEPITTDEAFVRYCSKEWVQQLCDGPRAGFMFLEAADIYRRKPSLTPFHELAEHVLNKYNSEQKENVEVKKVSKASWVNTFFFMTIEAWDKETNKERTFQTGVRRLLILILIITKEVFASPGVLDLNIRYIRKHSTTIAW